MKGFEESYKFSYQDLNAKLHEMGHAHPVSCVDCHDPQTMQLRVTRPGFINGIQALAASDAPVPHLPSVQQWREGSRAKPYDPNVDGSRTEMRSYVCGQCHVEYYCSTKMPLTFPWGKGLRASDTEKFWNETKFPDGEQFFDYKHAESGAKVLKAQHPEFELFSQGIHARSGVACADCHMPYKREGAMKISDHHVRSPVLNINRACQTCHKWSEEELASRVTTIQDRTFEMRNMAIDAVLQLTREIAAQVKADSTAPTIKVARDYQRKAQFLADFIEAENSMGFHADQEAARVLAKSIDYSRRGQMALRGQEPPPVTNPASATRPGTASRR
jgi:nitrite reductase (cytochrome c-552)